MIKTYFSKLLGQYCAAGKCEDAELVCFKTSSARVFALLVSLYLHGNT